MRWIYLIVEMIGFMKQTRDSLLNISGAFKQLNEGFNSVCAQFNNNKLLTESPKRNKTSLAAVNTVTVTTPNPNFVAAAVSVDTVVCEPTAPMDTAVLGEVTASRSRVVKKPSVPATVPTVPIGTEVTVSGSIDRFFSLVLSFKLIRDLALLFFFGFCAFMVLEFDPSAKFT